jgi:DNA-binding SARP family transcriptional activator
MWLQHHVVPTFPNAIGGSPRILVCLLGNVRILKDGDPVPIRPGGKTETLIAALALRPEQGVLRVALMDRIWSNIDPTLATQSLHSLVYSIHRRLGDLPSGEPPIVSSEGRYLLNLSAGVDVDTRQFERLVTAGDQAMRQGNRSVADGAYGAAIRLYRGDISCTLDAHDIVERERLRSIQLSVLARLSDGAFERKEYAACLDLTTRLLAADPCREDAHRLAMRCHVRRGERAQALRQYRLCEGILRAEFDTAPETETQELFDRVRLAPDTV